MGGPGSGKSRKPITRNRPSQTLFCRFRPNRSVPRTFREDDLIRIGCGLINSGQTTVPTITRRLETECEKATKPTDNAAEDALAEAQQALLASDDVFNDAFVLFQIINGILTGLSLILQLVPNPAVRVVARGAVVARINIAQVMTRIGAQRAANEDRIQQIENLRRATANLRRAA